jgi:phosphotransferase family enzyme
VTDWARYFADEGFGEARVLGQGMEGTVYALGAEQVAKVCRHRQFDEVRRLRDFYAHLAGQGLFFDTPKILDVYVHAGHVVSIECELGGTPLPEAIEAGVVTPARGRDCVLEVLAGLRHTRGGAACRELTVIDENIPLWGGHPDWMSALAALVDRRAERFGDQLRAAVTDFDGKLEHIRALLKSLPVDGDVIVHGDLIPANILVDAGGAVTAVLDWGFLTTEADPAFDASVTAAVYDMYSDAHLSIDRELLRRLADEGGYAMERLMLYRAVYAVITSNAFDPHGRDGHFAWCARMLDRPDVVAALT